MEQRSLQSHIQSCGRARASTVTHKLLHCGGATERVGHPLPRARAGRPPTSHIQSACPHWKSTKLNCLSVWAGRPSVASRAAKDRRAMPQAERHWRSIQPIRLIDQFDLFE